MTVHEVGNAMGGEGTTVSRRLKAAGVRARKPGVRLPVDDMQIPELRGRECWREVAFDVGMTAAGVRSRFYALRADGYEDPMPPRDYRAR